MIRSLADVDWVDWRARDHATLLFVQRDDQLLLIHKKRGLGKGKVNGPGGKIEPGETPVECAIRECHEEIGIEVRDPEIVGVHRFQFTDGYSIHCWVYRGREFRGTPIETDEAIPFWAPVDDLPFDEMWEDDRLWLPLLLEGKRFDGRWVFEGDCMLDHELREIETWPDHARYLPRVSS